MADSKITSLTVTTTLAAADVFPVVTDTTTTPANKKITTTNLAVALFAIAATTDFTSTGAGKGMVLTTPDGLHTYRIAVDNSGVLTTEQLT